MEELSEKARSFMLSLAIATRGDVSAEYPLQRYKAVQGTELKALVRELAVAQLIAPEGRNVRLTDTGRMRVETWLEQRLRLAGTLHPDAAANSLGSGMAAALAD